MLSYEMLYYVKFCSCHAYCESVWPYTILHEYKLVRLKTSHKKLKYIINNIEFGIYLVYFYYIFSTIGTRN